MPSSRREFLKQLTATGAIAAGGTAGLLADNHPLAVSGYLLVALKATNGPVPCQE